MSSKDFHDSNKNARARDEEAVKGPSATSGSGVSRHCSGRRIHGAGSVDSRNVAQPQSGAGSSVFQSRQSGPLSRQRFEDVHAEASSECLSEDYFPAPHSADVSPGFADAAWQAFGGSCARCGKVAKEVVLIGVRPSGFEIVEPRCDECLDLPNPNRAPECGRDDRL